MGYGALIGSLVSTGFSIYDQLSKKNPNSSLAEEATRINENAKRYVTPFGLGGNLGQSYWDLNIPGLAQQSLQFGYANAPQLNQFNMQQLSQMLTETMGPGWTNIAPQISQLAQGNVPADVQNQIQRYGAQAALSSGIGGGGAGTLLTGRNITARDLGLTSLDLMKEGTGMLGAVRNYLMPQPVSPTSLLPLSDLIAGSQWSKSALFEASVAAFQAQSAAATAQAGGVPNTSAGTGIGGALSGLFSNLGQKNPSTGQTGFQMLSGLFGGGGGGGGGGDWGSNITSGMGFLGGGGGGY